MADTAVEENNLNHNVSILRKMLGEKATGQAFIETVPRVGTASSRPWRWKCAPDDGDRVPRGTTRQELRYCMTPDGVRLAYATSGSGPPLVKTSNWLLHLDFEWESPIWRHWWEALSQHHRVIRYDERGNGMSQRDVAGVSFATWVQAGNGRRCGAAESVCASRHLTGRVDRHRVCRSTSGAGQPAGALRGLCRRVELHRDWGELEARRALTSLTRPGWGLNNPAFCKLFTCRFIPRATPAHEAWFDELQRVSHRPRTPPAR